MESSIGKRMEAGTLAADVIEVARMALDDDERTLVRAIVAHHESNMQKKSTHQAVLSLLKPMRQKAAEAALSELRWKSLPGRQTMAMVLSRDSSRERLRSIKPNNRVRGGIEKWPLSWMGSSRGFVCYERAAGRLKDEHAEWDGCPTVEYVKGLVMRTRLATAVACASDHYLVVSGRGELRWATVEEVARSLMVPARCPIMRMLRSPALTEIQAVSALGRSVHVGVARSILAALIEEGVLHAGITYGSAWSGIDVFAAAVDEELKGKWRYVFASEEVPRRRKALHEAWKSRGLRLSNCYGDAEGAEACKAPQVDLWFGSPECTAYSKRNHARSEEEQRDEIDGISRGLEYVRARMPRVVIVENVSEVSVVGPLERLLRQLRGYRMMGGETDPAEMAGGVAARERYYFVLVRSNL
jgi:hypothetical protein